MLNISDASKEIYLDGSIHKTLTINFPNVNVTLTNNDLIKESLELTEAIENENEINFQGCIASKLKFQCADIIQDLRGEYVTVTLGALGAEDIPLFKGYVDSQTNRTYEDVVTEFTCYDAIYRKGKLDVTNWYKGLTFPITVKAFRDSFFSHIGITQQSRTLINDSQRINKVVTDNQILALDIMRAICQVNGAYGQIGRDGKFKYVELLEIVRGLYPQETLYPSPDLYPARENAGAEFDRDGYINATYEPFEVSMIDRVNVVGFNGRFIGSYGSGTNAFTIADNIVAQGSITPNQLAKNLVEKLYMIKYIPSYVEVPGLPWVECGDIYLFNTYKNIIRAYVFNRVIKGIQTLIDEYTADGIQYRNSYIESPLTQTTANEVAIQENTADIETNTEDIATNAANIIYTQQLSAQLVESEKIRTNTLVANEIQAEKTRTNTLVANAIQTTELYADTVSTNKMNSAEAYARQLTADKATISQLNATNATISAVNAELVKTNTVLATKASIAQLNAVTINASQITSGTINADRISASTVIGKLAGNTVSCGKISAGTCDIGGGNLSRNVTYGGSTIATESWVSANFQRKS